MTMAELSMATTILVCVVLTMPFVSSFIVNAPSQRCGLSIRPRISLYAVPKGCGADVDTLRRGRVWIAKPAIHWTVPGFKVGWQDDDGNWFDEDGPRNGPPLNYWRQRSDEREYDEGMDAVDAVLAEYDVESKVKGLEKKRSVRRPSLSRKILGRWAPLLLSSSRVAYNDGPIDYDGNIEVPFTVDISRSNGRRFGPKTHYGMFDMKLENGEELTISTKGDDDDISTKIIADEANESVELGMVGQSKLRFGGITYVNDYILIQRCPDGAIDFFLRADESYLGVSNEELEKCN